MAKAKAPKPQANSDNENQEFIITDEMQQYISFKEAAGVVVNLGTDEERHCFTREFNSWVKAGKQRPKLPELLIEEDPIPMKLYRIKVLGRQKIFWRDTKAVLHWKSAAAVTQSYRATDSRGQDVIMQGQTRTTEQYTQDYTKTLGDKLVADALSRCVNPTFYFKSRGSTYSVRPEDFNEDFDEIVKLHQENKYNFS